MESPIQTRPCVPLELELGVAARLEFSYYVVAGLGSTVCDVVLSFS